MSQRDTSVSELCTQLGIKPVMFYKDVGPQGGCASMARRYSPAEPECSDHDDARSLVERRISPPRKQPDKVCAEAGLGTTAIHGSSCRAFGRSSDPMLTTFPPRRTSGNDLPSLAGFEVTAGGVEKE